MKDGRRSWRAAAQFLAETDINEQAKGRNYKDKRRIL